MVKIPKKDIEVFYSYADADEAYRDQLDKHLATLRQQGLIVGWYDGQIRAGTEWAREIDMHIKSAHIILLLVSADFIASSYRYEVEMKEALRRHETGEACVIPIILRPVDLKGTPFEHLQALPKDGQPVTKWPDPDDAYVNIVNEIRNIIEELHKDSSVRFLSSDESVQMASAIITLADNKDLPYIDWGQAPYIEQFCGRTKELTMIQQGIVEAHFRLVAILGQGGIGKTTLAKEVVNAIKDQFDYIFWRSLQLAPALKTILQDCLHFLSNQGQGEIPADEEKQISLLFAHLQQHRCLLIFDNVESIMRTETRTGLYQPGFENYGRLFYRLGSTEHQSCVLLTSREQLPEIVRGEGEYFAVRPYTIKGLDSYEGRSLLKDKGLHGEKATRDALVKLYGGHPLALKIITPFIKEVFDGDISNFLKHGEHIPTELHAVLENQFGRLSPDEKEILYWLAIEREPISQQELRENMLSLSQQRTLQEVLLSLKQRNFIEKHTRGFTLQMVIMEYITEKFVEQIVEEIGSTSIRLLTSHVLVKAVAKDYIRNNQIGFIRKPIAERLRETYGKSAIEQSLKRILAALPETGRQKQGYTAGNILSLLVELEYTLKDFDFSHQAIRQAYLQNMHLPDVQFVGSYFENSVFIDIIGITLSVAFSPDGDLLATGTANSEIRIWTTKDTRPLLTCSGHSDWVWSIAFSPDGSLLASSSGDKTVRLWDVKSGQCLKVLTAQGTWFPSVAFSPDGTMLAAGGNNHHVQIWTVINTGHHLEVRPLKTLEGHTDRVWTVTFSPDNRVVASGSTDQTIRLWDIDSEQCLTVLHDQLHPVRTVTFSPDGKTLASGGGNDVQLWDVKSSQHRKVFKGHSDWLRTVVFSVDGQILASGGEDRAIRLWNVNTGKCLKVLEGHTNRVRAIAFHPNSQILASGGEDQTLRLWDSDAGCLKTLHGYAHSVWTVAFSADGKQLVSISEDNTKVQIQLWNANTGQLLTSMRNYSHRVRSVVFSPDGRCLVSGCEDRTVLVWNIDTGQILKVLRGHSSRVWSVAFSSDGSILGSSSEDKTIRLWNAKTDECLKVLQGHARQVWTIAFSSQGHILASGSEDNTIRLWNVSTGECFKVLQGHMDGVWSVVFSPDGNMLASASGDHTVRLWDTHTWQCVKTLQGHGSRVWSVAFSYDGSMVISSSEDKTLRLWDVTTGECLKVLEGHIKQIRFVTSHPKRLLFVSASDDGTMMFWDGVTGQCTNILTSPKPYERMNITNATGLTTAQRDTLKALGAIDI